MSETQKTAVIFGLANKRSIAWAIAQKLHEAGWRLAITYQNERLEQEAKDLLGELPGSSGFMCDVASDEQIAKLFEELKGKYGVLHGMVHSVAFAPAEDLKGDFVNTSREGFRIAHDISAYSLLAVARSAAPLMTDGGGIVTMTYYGAERVVQRNGGGEGRSRSDSALSCERPRSEKDSGQCCVRRAHQDAGLSRCFRLRRDAESARRTGAAEAKCRCVGGGLHERILVVRRRFGNHRRNDLRRLRLQHNGVLTSLQSTTHSLELVRQNARERCRVRRLRSETERAQTGTSCQNSRLPLMDPRVRGRAAWRAGLRAYSDTHIWTAARCTARWR